MIEKRKSQVVFLFVFNTVKEIPRKSYKIRFWVVEKLSKLTKNYGKREFFLKTRSFLFLKSNRKSKIESLLRCFYFVDFLTSCWPTNASHCFISPSMYCIILLNLTTFRSVHCQQQSHLSFYSPTSLSTVDFQFFDRLLSPKRWTLSRKF